MQDALKAFQRLTEIVEELREKCPWDRVQTKESLRHLTIEETYELAEAILEDDYEEIRVELGDLLLHVLFYTSLADEKGAFSLAEMIQSQIDKLIRRHPHIYGDVDVNDEAAVKANWEQIKARERAEKGKVKASALDGVPDHLPALIKAQRMQEKAANMGFDWENKEQVWEKFEEELAEFRAAKSSQDKQAEMGDILFTLVNYCRKAGLNAEDALAGTNIKFKHRFQRVEAGARQAGKSLKEMSLEEMEALWQAAKK